MAMVYVALLRGINVGGNARVEMPRLKKVFESLGLSSVLTYINSGNVIFSDMRTKETLVPLIEKAIHDEFRLGIRIVLRDLPGIQKLCDEIPTSWANDTEQKTDVLFLWDEIDDRKIVTKVVHNPAFEHVIYIAGALVWNIGRENVTRGNGVKLIKTDLYKYMTIRNINTVRKLKALMEESGD